MGERSGGSKGWPARAFRSPSHSSRPEEAQWDLLTGKFPGPAGIGVMAGRLFSGLMAAFSLDHLRVVGTARSSAKCTSRRPGRSGVGRRGPRDRRVTAEHVTQPASTSLWQTCSRVKVRSRGLSDVLASRPRHDMRDAVPPCKTTSRGGAGLGGEPSRRPDRHHDLHAPRLQNRP